jgi:hypothetical protein
MWAPPSDDEGRNERLSPGLWVRTAALHCVFEVPRFGMRWQTRAINRLNKDSTPVASKTERNIGEAPRSNLRRTITRLIPVSE